jgi:hypothetical protein
MLRYAGMALLATTLSLAGRPGTAGPVADGLTAATAVCRDNFDRESLAKAEQINDVRNGYMSIAGSYPTCGCTCESTASAFKTDKGRYKFLAYSEASCAWASDLNGTDWKDVLPKNIRSEFGIGLGSYEGDAVFYLKAKLPRKGTTVELTLGLMPFGQNMSCPSGICMTRSEEVASLAEKPPFVAAVMKRYRHYKRVKVHSLILKWDRARGRLTVVKRIPAKQLPLDAFEKACGRWGAVC